VTVLSLTGRTMLRNAIWSDPVVLWQEAADRAPTHWLPALVLGESLHKAGRHDEAILALNHSVRLNPDEPAAYSNLGVCLLETGHLAAAMQTFNELKSREPRSPEASNGRGAAALAGGQPETARQRFHETLEVDPRNIEARRGLALINEVVDRSPEDALKRCEEIRLLAPETPGNEECIARNRARVNDGPAKQH
jgi:Flp pilus assembly protein TadD